MRTGIYAITDYSHYSHESVISITRKLLESGIAMLQYRNKLADYDTACHQAAELLVLCQRHDTPLIINDSPDIAVAIGADGVHLGIDDPDCQTTRNMIGPDMIIGVSCYDDIGLAVTGQKNGANYAAFGAFYSSSSKETTRQPGVFLINQAKQCLTIPIVAIGGITPENGLPLVNHGADMLAIISSLYQADDPEMACKQFQNLFKQTG